MPVTPLTSDVSVAVVPRDRFSTMPACVANVLETVPADLAVHVIVGGAPASIVAEMRGRFGDRIELHERDEFLSTSTGRNVALEVCATPLLAIVDGDSYPRPGWLEPLVECHRETGAASVVGVILERPDAIHCAGTTLYVDEVDGARQGWKVLHCYGLPFHDRCELPATRVDYTEQHAHLCDVEAHRAVGGFDPLIGEGSEVDTGLALAKGGHESWFVPDSVTFFHFDGPIDLIDTDYFTWRWHEDNILSSYAAFEEKWGIDISEGESFRDFVGIANSQLPRLARTTRNPLMLRLTRAVRRPVRAAVWLPYKVYVRLRTRRWAPNWQT